MRINLESWWTYLKKVLGHCNRVTYFVWSSTFIRFATAWHWKWLIHLWFWEDAMRKERGTNIQSKRKKQATKFLSLKCVRSAFSTP